MGQLNRFRAVALKRWFDRAVKKGGIGFGFEKSHCSFFIVRLPSILLGKRPIKAGREIAGTGIDHVNRNICDDHVGQRGPRYQIRGGLDGLGLVDLGIQLEFKIGVGTLLGPLQRGSFHLARVPSVLPVHGPWRIGQFVRVVDGVKLAPKSDVDRPVRADGGRRFANRSILRTECPLLANQLSPFPSRKLTPEHKFLCPCEPRFAEGN